MTRRYGPCIVCCGGLWLEVGEVCPMPSCGRVGHEGLQSTTAAEVRAERTAATPPRARIQP